MQMVGAMAVLSAKVVVEFVKLTILVNLKRIKSVNVKTSAQVHFSHSVPLFNIDSNYESPLRSSVPNNLSKRVTSTECSKSFAISNEFDQA